MPDDATEPQEENTEEQRFAQIMRRVTLGRTFRDLGGVLAAVDFEGFAKKNT